MKKPIIGIIPDIDINKGKFPKKGNFVPLDFIKKLQESGAEVIILGVSGEKDDISQEILSICDGFLFMSGNYFFPYHLEAMGFAVKNHVPVLGICLGMQVMGAYSAGVELENITDLKRDLNINHDPKILVDKDRGKPVHKVNLKKDSIIHRLFGDEVLVNSRHMHYISKVEDPFIITGLSEDGIIEVVEYKDKDNFIIGVQWHPEAMDTMKPLFDFFIEKVRS